MREEVGRGRKGETVIKGTGRGNERDERERKGKEKEGGEERENWGLEDRRCAVGIFNYFRLWVRLWRSRR